MFIPVRRDDLIPALLDGRGDIAASGITVTASRDKLIDFSNPVMGSVSEIVVSGPGSPKLSSIGDLSGKEVFVRKSSSYYEHLQKINADLQKAGKPPMTLRLAPESLEDEDLLQMLNAGLVQFVSWMTRLRNCGSRSCPRSPCIPTLRSTPEAPMPG